MEKKNPLDDIDLSRMTLEDIRKIDNPVIRMAIIGMIAGPVRDQPQHTSHGMHTSHLMSDITEEREFLSVDPPER